MKQAVSLVRCFVLAMVILPLVPCHGEPPGAEESAEVDRANAGLDKTYHHLMSTLDQPQQNALRAAERAWITWRDAEAGMIAHLSAVDGSAYRVDYRNAQIRLIDERAQTLKEYLEEAHRNQ